MYIFHAQKILFLWTFKEHFRSYLTLSRQRTGTIITSLSSTAIAPFIPTPFWALHVTAAHSMSPNTQQWACSLGALGPGKRQSDVLLPERLHPSDSTQSTRKAVTLMGTVTQSPWHSWGTWDHGSHTNRRIKKNVIFEQAFLSRICVTRGSRLKWGCVPQALGLGF